MANLYYMYLQGPSVLTINQTDYNSYTSSLLISTLGTVVTVQNRNLDGTSDGSAPINVRVASVAATQLAGTY